MGGGPRRLTPCPPHEHEVLDEATREPTCAAKATWSWRNASEETAAWEGLWSALRKRGARPDAAREREAEHKRELARDVPAQRGAARRCAIRSRNSRTGTIAEKQEDDKSGARKQPQRREARTTGN